MLTVQYIFYNIQLNNCNRMSQHHLFIILMKSCSISSLKSFALSASFLIMKQICKENSVSRFYFIMERKKLMFAETYCKISARELLYKCAHCEMLLTIMIHITILYRSVNNYRNAMHLSNVSP